MGKINKLLLLSTAKDSFFGLRFLKNLFVCVTVELGNFAMLKAASYPPLNPTRKTSLFWTLWSSGLNT